MHLCPDRICRGSSGRKGTRATRARMRRAIPHFVGSPRGAGVRLAILRPMKSFLFVLRHALRWGALSGFVAALLDGLFFRHRDASILGLLIVGAVLYSIVRAYSHVHRVHLIANRLDFPTLSSRHRRQVEVPFGADEAFAMVDAAIRELPHVDSVESARDSLQVKARVRRMDPYLRGKHAQRAATGAAGARRNLVSATIAPGAEACSLTIVCEPEGGA